MLDEAHALKNANSQRSRRLRKLASSCRGRVMLTGGQLTYLKPWYAKGTPVATSLLVPCVLLFDCGRQVHDIGLHLSFDHRLHL